MPPFNVSIPSRDGQSFGAYLARAARPSAPVLILIQEIFGVNAGMRAMCDAYAAEGYHALCPDLFWRQEAGVDLSDKTQDEWNRAFALYNGFDVGKGLEDLLATLAVARSLEGGNGKAASIGFCLGGKMAYLMATASDAECHVSYYGVGLDDMLDKVMDIKKPLLLHIAGKDKFVPPEAQMKIRAATSRNPRIATYVYDDADHAFARVRGQNFDAAAAALAADRTRAFLAQNLG